MLEKMAPFRQFWNSLRNEKYKIKYTSRVLLATGWYQIEDNKKYIQLISSYSKDEIPQKEYFLNETIEKTDEALTKLENMPKNTFLATLLQSSNREILKTYIEKNINLDSNHRWENGIEHHPKSEELMDHLMALDFEVHSDFFCFKRGGDGDNGEELMYLLDMFFELKDKEK